MRFMALMTVLSLTYSAPPLAAQQDLVGFDRASFGSVVLSRKQAAGGSDVELELAVGSYNNESIRNYSPASVFSKMGHSVGRLDILTDNGIFPCTAFIVDRKHILTNYHCVPGILDNEKAKATRIDAVQFVAGYTQQGVTEGTKTYTVSPTPVEAHQDLDFAVLEVLGDPSAQYGTLKLASNAPAPGDPYWVIGHPMGEAQRISREKCKANSPALSGERLLHTCDTLPGNSGSPVIDASLQMVVGLHHAGSKRDSVNFAIPMAAILDRSNVLEAALRDTPAPTPQPDPKPNPNPVPNPNPPVIDEEAALCDALYKEAKEYGQCFGYKAYVETCGKHRFAPFAKAYISEQCAPVVAPTPDPKPQPPVQANTPRRSWCTSSRLNATEQAICGSDYLAGLDEELEQAYAARPSHISASSQGRWRTSTRDACGANSGCIASAVIDRIAVLKSSPAPTPPQQNTGMVPGNYTLSSSQCYIVTASRTSLSEAQAFARQWFSGNSGIRYFQSSNGYYAVVYQTVSKSGSEWELNRLKSANQIPNDSYCSTGTRFISEYRTSAAPAPTPSTRTLYVDNNNDGGLNVRSGPGTNYNYFTEIDPGTKLSVLGSSGKWSNVKLPDGRVGWVYTPLLTSSKPYVRQCQAQVTGLASINQYNSRTGTGFLAVRSKPSTKGTKLSEVYQGDTVRVVAQSGNWARIECMSGSCRSPIAGTAGARGWSSKKYLSIWCQ